MMLMQRSQVRKCFINSKMKAYIQRKLVLSNPGSGSRIKRGGALPMKYSKYFGAKRRGFIKCKSVLAPKGAIHLLSENIRYDKFISGDGGTFEIGASTGSDPQDPSLQGLGCRQPNALETR
jgi:hypothetical protein